MPRIRRRTALLALLVGVLLALCCDTVWNRTATERIHHGMTLREVQFTMRDRGKGAMMTRSGSDEGHEYLNSKYGYPNLLRWEDAYSTVDVMFRAPEPETPVVVNIKRTPKTPPAEFGPIQTWRIVLAVLTLLGLVVVLWLEFGAHSP
jgi:hypothetical protein